MEMEMTANCLNDLLGWPDTNLLKGGDLGDDLTQLDEESAWGSSSEVMEGKNMFDFDTDPEVFHDSFLQTLDFQDPQGPPSFLTFDNEPVFESHRNVPPPPPQFSSGPAHRQQQQQQRQQHYHNQQEDIHPVQQQHPYQLNPMLLGQYPQSATVYPRNHIDSSSSAPVQNLKRKSSKIKLEGTNQMRKKQTLQHQKQSAVSSIRDKSSSGNHLSIQRGIDNSADRTKQTSSFRGVSCCGKDRKWQARIRDANRVRYLGRFSTEVEAALVYDDAARSLKGERAPTNFVKMEEDLQDDLKAACLANNGNVPSDMMHLVVRSKSKLSAAGKTRSSSQDDAVFPDSPLAKLKGDPPAFNPVADKSTSSQKGLQQRDFHNCTDQKIQPQPQVDRAIAF